jgi:superfamily II DNA or RNA helicase
MIFYNIDEARKYIEEQLERGMACSQRFTLDGGIEVTCRLNVGFSPEAGTKKNVRVLPTHQSTLFDNPSLLDEPKATEKIIKQEIFPQNQNFDLPYELRDYQAQAVAFALAHRHAIIELPTGRGKTLTALAIVNEIIKTRPQKTLVLVPTTVLLDQWIHDGFEAAGVEASGVGGGEKQWGEYTVVTYQSAIRNLDRIPQYGIVIFDEVHHLFSPEYSKILMTILSSPGASLKYLIGLTATVREYGEGKIMQNKYFPDVFSKTLEEFQKGTTRIPTEIKEIPVYFSDEETALYDSYQSTIKKANRVLGPVPEWQKYMNSWDEITRRLALSAIRDYSAQKRLLTETPQKLDMVLKILHEYPGQFIIFSDTIDGIQEIEKALRSHGITEGSIYSGVPDIKRRQIIQGLRDGSIRVLVGGNAISEGLDLPDISNVILTSMLVKSTRTPVQRLGRVLRPAPGKHVRIFLIYVRNTLEEANAKRIYDILGEDKF